jgi:hypothetical protein
MDFHPIEWMALCVGLERNYLALLLEWEKRRGREIVRSVVTESDVKRMAADPQRRGELVKADDPIAQIGKSIPAEVLSFYLFGIGAISLASATSPIETASWAIFVIGLIFTVGYSVYEFKKEGALGIAIKTALTTVAFVVWSLNMGGYTKYIPGFDQLTATIVLGAYTLATPLAFKIYDLYTKPKPITSQDFQ